MTYVFKNLDEICVYIERTAIGLLRRNGRRYALAAIEIVALADMLRKNKLEIPPPAVAYDTPFKPLIWNAGDRQIVAITEEGITYSVRSEDSFYELVILGEGEVRKRLNTLHKAQIAAQADYNERQYQAG